MKLLVMFLLVCAAGAQQTTPTLVHMDTEVIFEGHAQVGLTRDDFRMFDERKPQPIVRFAGEEQPLDVLLVFDAVTGMRPAAEAIADAAHAALHELHAGDRVGIMVFERQSRLILPFTADLDAVERAMHNDLLGLGFSGMSKPQTSADDAAKLLLAEPKTERRRAVLHIELGMGVATRFLAPTAQRYWEADAVYNSLLVHRFAGKATTMALGLGLPGLAFFALTSHDGGTAGWTGGDTISARDPGAAFQESLHRIRSRSSLWYEQPPGKPGRYCKVLVKLSDAAAKRFPKAKVRARYGYVMADRK